MAQTFLFFFLTGVQGIPWVDGHRLCGVVGLVDAHQAVSQLKHIVAQADDHELRILGPLLDIVRHNRHILEVCRSNLAHIHSGLQHFTCSRAWME